MNLDALGARFEACALGKREWTHAAHLCVGLWSVLACRLGIALVSCSTDRWLHGRCS